MNIFNVAAFLPTYVAEKKWKSGHALTSTDVAWIISVFSVAQIIFAPFNSKIKNYAGSKNAILIGFLVMTLMTFALGLLSIITDSV